MRDQVTGAAEFLAPYGAKAAGRGRGGVAGGDAAAIAEPR